MLRVYLNGRLVHEARRVGHCDPWIGFYSWWNIGGSFRDVRIVGTPQIPRNVVISSAASRNSWQPYHEASSWDFVEDPDSTGQIVGARRSSLKGAQNESLLSYHRPLTDGDSVEYDFLYEPGRQITHPAMDRLAFIVNPDRVRFHWITDGRYDRTELPPDNLFEEVEGTLRRVDPEAVNGSDDKKLPLRPGEWNHAKLTLSGNSAALEINGHRVCERILPSNSRRTFGLFYDIGEEGVRVRNVVMKGNWPEVLPSTAEQELADRRVAELDKGLPALKSVFKNDFAKDGVSNLIEICNLGDLELTLRSDGKSQRLA
jgi:hypothetical protein